MSKVVYPQPIKDFPDVTLRLGIKSSVSNIRSLLGCIISLCFIDDENYIIDYCDETIIDNITSISLSNNFTKKLDLLFENQLKSIGENSINQYFDESPIIKTHMEALQVGLEVFFRLGKMNFKDPPFSNAKERTKGVRFSKLFKPSSNLNLLKIFFENDKRQLSSQAKDLLFFWITNKNEPLLDKIFYEKVRYFLLLLTEDTIFKMMDTRESEVIFKQLGIYEQLIAGKLVFNKGVNDEKGRNKDVGPFRVLKNFIKEDLHPYIINTPEGFTLRPSVDIEQLNYYKKSLETNFEITPKKTIIYQQDDIEKSSELVTKNISFPLNLILYGAPGTGKSYNLNKDANSNFPKENITRVTFYPNYAYYNFVGAFRPKPIYANIVDDRKLFDTDKKSELVQQKEPIIDYTFVPGPFLTQLVNALNNPEKSYLLIIEEINRANAATVFGDIFQLFDRNKDGVSEYSIKLNPEITAYLKQNLEESINRDFFETKEIKLPSNLYLWATMNSADQGVQPMDAAFKRRWSFQYLPLNKNESERAESKIKLNFLNTADKLVSWNYFREQLNNYLKEELKIQEDRLIGPFFLKEEELLQEDAIKNKLLLYLREDIARHNSRKLFKQVTFSDIILNYDAGKEIFNFLVKTESSKENFDS